IKSEALRMASRRLEGALILVDVQNDFCPGGALAVDGGDEIVPIINKLIPGFSVVISTQDWHPADHISFKQRGGPWPPHCVQGSHGADLHSDLKTDTISHYFRKASTSDKDDYSEFAGTDDEGRTLDDVLKEQGLNRLYVAGLATDYCVLETVLDGLNLGYEVYAVTDAMKAVNVNPDDGDKALRKMSDNGARLVHSDELLNLAGTSVTAS